MVYAALLVESLRGRKVGFETALKIDND